MHKDQAVGGLLLIGSIVVSLLYVYGVFFTDYALLLLKLTASVAVLGVLFILAWIGYTLATTPPPPPIEEIEKELEEELKKLEEEGEEETKAKKEEEGKKE